MNEAASKNCVKTVSIVAAFGFALFAMSGYGRNDRADKPPIQANSRLPPRAASSQDDTASESAETFRVDRSTKRARYLEGRFASVQVGAAWIRTEFDMGSGPMIASFVEKVPEPTARTEVDQEVDRVMTHLAKKEYGKALKLATTLVQTKPDNPVGYNLQGAAYLGKHDLANARKSFEKALSVRKDDESAQMNLAQLDLQQKDFASARNQYQKILATDAKNVLAMLGMAKLEAMNKNEKESFAWLERAKVANPASPAPRLLLGSHYLRAKNYDKALAELTEAQRSHPNNPNVLDLLGQAQAASGQGASAVSTYQKLVSVRPESAGAYQRLAAAQTSIADYSGAMASLKKALELKPDYVEALDSLARLEVRAGRHAEAFKRAQQIQHLAPKSPTGYALEGDVLFDQKRFSQAAAVYEKALALSPTGILAIRLYSAQVKADKPKEANAKLQKWLKDHPKDTVVRLYLGEEYGRTGRSKEATEQYLAVLQKDPKNVVALNNLANIYHRQNDPRAIQMAEEAFKLRPDSAAIADTLGWMLVEQGNTARGLEMLQRAAAQAPRNTEIRYHLAAALAKSGEKAKARKELENLLESTQQFPQREAARTLLNQL